MPKIPNPDFSLGDEVSVSQEGSEEWRKDWERETYFIIGIHFIPSLDRIDYTLASDYEIDNKYRGTDGFSASDLVLVKKCPMSEYADLTKHVLEEIFRKNAELTIEKIMQKREQSSEEPRK